MRPMPGVRMRASRPSWPRAAGKTLLVSIAFLAGCATTSTRPPTAAELPMLEARVTASPGDSEAALRLAQAYRAASRLDDARVLLERSRANSPGDSRLSRLLGLTYEDLGRFSDARGLYEAYLESPSGSLRRQARERLALVAQGELRQGARQALAREAELSALAPSPATVAVFPFRVETRDTTLRPLGRALAEMLVTDLSQSSRLTVLERARVQALLDEAQLGGGITEPATAVRAGRLLTAGTVVQGRISGDNQLRMEALLAASGGDGSGPTVTRQTALQRLLDEEKELALGIYQQMGVELTPAERERVTRRMTQNVQALLVFGAALQASDAGEHARAAELFRQAADMDATFVVARLRAASAASATVALQTGTTAVAALIEQEAPETLGLEPTAVAPIPIGRDPTSEALGSEGFSRPRTTVQIIITRP